MKNATLLLVLLLSAAPAHAGLKAATAAEIEDLSLQIRAAGAAWTAGETPVSGADDGYLAGLQEELTPSKTAPLPEHRALPRKLDWRSRGGASYVTPARSQKECGSCWAFAQTAALESYIMRKTGLPGIDLDLSEQVMLSCSGIGSCKGGVLKPTFLVEKGLPPETAYPYEAADGKCSTAAAGWQEQAYRLADWGVVLGGSAARLKAALNAYGPLVTSMQVYGDLKHYKSGIYTRVSGKRAGAHAVLLVGYNDDEGYFIVKNSWGENWGEKGFFRIAYSEMFSRVFFAAPYSVAYYPQADKAEIPARTFGAAQFN
jgi:C1A family cysteine protease